METVTKEKMIGGSFSDGFKNFIKKAEAFCQTEVFIFCAALVALLFHAICLDLFGILIFCACALFAFLFFEDGRAGIVILVSALFSVSRKNGPGYMYESSPQYYFQPKVLIPLIIAACLVFAAIIYKCIKNRENYKRASLVIPFAVVALTITLSGVGREHYGESFFFGLVMGVSYLGIYMLVAGCLNKKAGLMDYVATFFSALALLISLQLTLLYATHILKGGSFNSEWKGNINIGWGISNSAGAALALFLPFTLYKAEKSKNYLFYLVISLFSLAMLVLTLSRTSLLIAFPIYAVLFVKTLIYSKNRQNILLITVIVCSVALILLMSLSAWTDFSTIFSRLESLFNKRNPPSLSGRDKFWAKAWRFFKESPWVGEGFARSYSEPVLHNENSLFQSLFHNVIFQVLGSSGLMGVVVASGFTFFITKIYLSKYKGKMTTICFAITFVGISLLDIIYFMPHFVFFILLVTVVIEKTAIEKEKIERLKMKKASK